MWRPLLLLSLVCTCVPLPFGEHGTCAPVSDLTPGTYASTGGRWENETGRYPHAEAGGKTLLLQRQADGKAGVRISYARAGKAIVETWQDDGSHPEIHWAPALDPPSSFTLSPAAFDLGAVEIGGSRRASFIVQNAGRRVSRQPVVQGTGDGFVFTHMCGALLVDGKCSVGVEFRPTTTGVFTGSLAVNTGAGTPTAMATVTGVGVLRDASPATPDASPDAPSPGDAGLLDQADSGEGAGPDVADATGGD